MLKRNIHALRKLIKNENFIIYTAFIFQNKSHVHRLIKQYSDLSNRNNNSITLYHYVIFNEFYPVVANFKCK